MSFSRSQSVKKFQENAQVMRIASRVEAYRLKQASTRARVMRVLRAAVVPVFAVLMLLAAFMAANAYAAGGGGAARVRGCASVAVDAGAGCVPNFWTVNGTDQSASEQNITLAPLGPYMKFRAGSAATLCVQTYRTDPGLSGGFQVVADTWHFSSQSGWEIFFSGTQFTFRQCAAGTCAGANIASVTPDAWHSFCVVKSALDLYSVYFDGALSTTFFSSIDGASGGEVCLSGWCQFTDGKFRGKIRNLVFFGIELSGATVAALNVGLPLTSLISDAGMISGWTFTTTGSPMSNVMDGGHYVMTVNGGLFAP